MAAVLTGGFAVVLALAGLTTAGPLGGAYLGFAFLFFVFSLILVVTEG